MSSCANAVHFYGIQLPEDKVKVIYQDWELFEKEVADYDLNWYMDGCHVAGDNNRAYIGDFDTVVWQYGSKKIKKGPSAIELVQTDKDIKLFCKAIGVKYKKPAWWLIAYYG